jgi:predicted MPP superfamily phosphohydrolase
MKGLPSFLRELIFPDWSRNTLKSENPALRAFAFLYLGAQPVAVFLALWAFWWEPRGLTLNTYDFETPPELTYWRGKSIAVITDLHAGAPYIDEDKIEKVVDLTLSAHPDLVLLTGDFVIQNVIGGRYMPPAVIASHLKRLRAPLGVYAVMGNHDNWDTEGRVDRHFKAASLRVLDDEVVNLPGTHLWLAGLSDFYTREKRYAQAVKSMPPKAAAVCMTHSPDTFPVSPPVCRLVIAGHTHGGQVNLPFIGTPITSSNYGSRYVKGFVTENGRTVFVSSGIGTSGIPVRFRVPPEVSLLRMR